jgi:CO/xanthine dehydrogenase Mo-binding subunit
MNTSRRDFLKMSGCLTIGFSMGNVPAEYFSPVTQVFPESLKRDAPINSWLEILADGRVRILTGKMELGQGIRTALSQVAAEELDLEMQKVEVKLVETGRTPDEGYTVGSGSMEHSAMAVRYAAAAARGKLLQLAATKFGVPANQLDTYNGQIYTKNKTRTISFQDLLQGKQITDEVRPPVKLKPKEKYRLVGKPILRDDIRQMVRARQKYVQDLQFEGMVHARVVRPPAYHAKLMRFDEQQVKKNVDGLLKIVNRGSFLAVIAEDEYQAMKAQQLLRSSATWSQSASLPSADATQLQHYIKALPSKTDKVAEKGKLPADEFAHRASYFKPYLMHGSIGPSCAVALYEKEMLHVWSNSQGAYALRDALADLLKMPVEQIHVVGVPGSGCYGHNGADDVAADAAIAAMAFPGKHVRLQWSREDEHAWEPYGSAMIMEVAANLNNEGRITHWKYALWSDTHSTRPGGRGENLLAARYLESPRLPGEGYSGGASRNSEPYYSIPNLLVESHFFKGPLRVSALRSLGAYANIFAIESFMDELAEKAGKDPFIFRLMHLEDERAIAVLKKLQALTGEQKKSAGVGFGIAFSRYKNTAAYCAVASLVAVDAKEQKVQVQKMWAVIEAGEAINTDGLKNQIQGGMIQSASWTLMEQVKFDDRHVTSNDWVSYPIFRFADVPEVEVEVLSYPVDGPLGAGEAAQGPAGASIANAVYAACGRRVRELPMLRESLFA